ncbi:MAG: hypothetical protein ACOZQL_17790 [Myxococcota bacterium]
MRLSPWSVILLLPLALSACQPTVGGACSTSDEWKCKSSTETWACISGKWATVPCAGPRGCSDTGTWACDTLVATAGAPCLPNAQGQLACQTLPPALLTCAGSAWVQSQPCSSCTVARGVPECVTGSTGGGGGATGGGGGSTGGGGGTTGGGTGGGGGSTGGGGGTTGGGGGASSCGPSNCAGCCANGQCMPTEISGTPSFCGTAGAACDDCASRGQRCENFTCVAATMCNPTTCPNGCCANGQCFNAPLNNTTNFCGRSGNACSDCGRLGLVCNAATSTCVVSPTGGGGGTTGGGGGTTGGGGGATGGGGGSSDPCQGVPSGGQCVTSTLVQYCSIPTGNGTPSVQTYQCPGGSVCQSTGAGAACVQTGSCVQGDTRCSGATSIQECSAQGTWGAAQSCGSPCQATAVGANCMLSVATTTVTGRLLYETRNAPARPLTASSDWSAATPVPARNVLVVSQRTSGTSSSWIDATTTDANGNFTIKVPASATANDSVLFAAIGGDGLGMRYAVRDPGLGTGSFSVRQVGSSPRYWVWSRAASTVTSGSTITVTQAQGSGALNIFDLLQSIWASSVTANQGKQGYTLNIWMGLGTEWSCGACFSQDSNGFETGIWMPGASQDQGYWSDYTIAHELGHWQMASYGTSPNEGGTHCVTVPTLPGQAWSEGYASWHSAAVRNQPYLEDKQGGGFFAFDISSRTYYPQSTAINGLTGSLLGQIDENAVAAILWAVSSSRSTGTREIFNAVASPHMNSSPWPRNYTRHTWSVDSNCNKTNVTDTGQPSMHLADALDVLSCGVNRMPANNLLRACSSPPTTTNGAYYPYPTSAPICRSGFCYGCLSGSTCNAGNTNTACGSGGVDCVQCGANQTCLNGVCQ